MITETSGNLLNAEADVLVNTVNCVGAMGKGIAADFKKRYPDMYVDYVRRCDQRAVRPGRPYAWVGDGKTIINFPTKQHWRGSSRLEWVMDGLPRLVELATAVGARRIAVPPLGCGHGGLDWAEVRPLMHAALASLTIPVLLYVPRSVTPAGTPQQDSLFEP
jgi:O-acetyl-ADP-ribose deacetylase (regulator of RNase III)